jgi:hypothetical protein
MHSRQNLYIFPPEIESDENFDGFYDGLIACFNEKGKKKLLSWKYSSSFFERLHLLSRVVHNDSPAESVSLSLGVSSIGRESYLIYREDVLSSHSQTLPSHYTLHSLNGAQERGNLFYHPLLYIRNHRRERRLQACLDYEFIGKICGMTKSTKSYQWKM